MTQRQLADTVVIDPGIKPEDIRDCLVDNVNLAWRAGGNNGFCHITANFVGWMLQENDRLTRDLAAARAEVVQVTGYRDGLVVINRQLEAEIERLRAALGPFADIHLAQDGDKRAPDMIEGPDLAITPKQVRAARDALGEPQSDNEQSATRMG